MKSLSFRKDLVEVQGELLRFAYKLTTDREEANDLLQETSLKALDNEDKYMPDTNFKGWMYTIMRNIFINNYRRQSRGATLVDTTEDLYQLNPAQVLTAPSPEGLYTVKEIGEAISRFPETYRKPFTMYVAGYKYSEIAQQMQLPLGTIKSRIFFTRKKLQTILKDYR